MARKKSRDFQAEGSDASSDDNSETEQTRCSIICNYFIRGLKRFLTFLFSHVGLTSAIVGYSVLGGFMFKAIELPNEQEVRKLAVETVNRYSDIIVKFTGSDSENEMSLQRSLWDKKLQGLLALYEQEIHDLTSELGWDGQLGDEPYQWTFANSLLYSVTIITTIGYGNVTPKTKGGRLLSIIYAIFGIPLTMLCLRNIGDLLAGFFRVGYRLSCTNMTYQYIKLKRRRLKNRFVKRLQKKTNDLKHWAHSKQSLVSHMIHRQVSTRSDESREIINKHDRAVTNVTPASSLAKGSSSTLLHKVELLPFTSENVQPIEELSSDEDEVVEIKPDGDLFGGKGRRDHGRKRSKSFQFRRRNSADRHHDPHLHRKMSMGPSKPIDQPFERTLSTMNDLSIIPEDSTDFDLRRPTSPKSEMSFDKSSSTSSDLSIHDFEEDDLRLKERLKSTRDFVPISVCLLLVTGYIIGGAILFTSWEQGWDFLIGFYFCFITLSTIGFGDFVPGMVNQSWDSDGRRWICIVYLVFGMALLAMSFHLIQEEVRHKFRKLAIKIGLIEERLTQMLDKYDKET